MNRIELERAWPAAEPPPGFSERVVEQALRGTARPEPVSRRANWLGWLTPPRVRGLALSAVVLAIAGVFLLWSTRPAREGDVIAAEPRAVSIGERAVAELSSGAHVRWSGDEAEQDRGEVLYRVAPGGRFRVRTPYGSVAVRGTVFRVVVTDRNAAGGEPMKKQWAVAGASATLGALLWVSVDRGSVSLANGQHELVLGAGQSGSIGSDGIPRLEAAAPSAPTEARHAAEGDAERTRARPVADGSPAPPRPSPESRIKAALRERRQRVLDSLTTQPPQAAANAPLVPTPPTQGKPGTMRDRTGVMPETVKAINEQFGPLVDQCFEQAHERGVNQRGMLGLAVKLASAEGVGRIIEAVEPTASNEVDDAELIDCMRESAFTVDLPAEGSGHTGFVMTIPYAPSPDAGAASGQH